MSGLELVIDTRRTAAPPGAVGRPEMVWLERGMPDGSVKTAIPLARAGHMPDYLTELRMRTVLEPRQTGDVLAGMLQVRLQPQDEEAKFPIRYYPYRDGEEVRILPSPEGQGLALALASGRFPGMGALGLLPANATPYRTCCGRTASVAAEGLWRAGRCGSRLAGRVR